MVFDTNLGVITIRRATANDNRDLGLFFEEAWKRAGPNALGFTGTTEESIREIASEAFLGRILSTPSRPIFVAEEGKRIVGFSSLREVDRFAIELSGMVVLEEYSGRGVGSILFEKSNEFAVKAGYRKIMVKTEVFNERAIVFYKKLRFLETERTTEVVNGQQVSLLTLEKSID